MSWLHIILFSLVFPFCTDTDDEVPSESDNESESEARIKVPPPPPLTDRGTKESDSDRTSSSDVNKGTFYCILLPSNHSFKQMT